MADFRLRVDAERWFSHIANKDPIRTKFDLYYFCLMAGFASGRHSAPAEVAAAPGFVDAMPEEYRPSQELIVGILLYVEIRRLGIELTDRDDVRRILAQMVGSNGLSATGVAKMNDYASGGFEALQESGIPAPYSAAEFLVAYEQFIRNCFV
jgi:hypothetical protein